MKSIHRTKGEQNFCYTLGFQLGQGLVEGDVTQDKEQMPYKPSHLCSLNDVLNDVSSNSSGITFFIRGYSNSVTKLVSYKILTQKITEIN